MAFAARHHWLEKYSNRDRPKRRADQRSERDM